MGIELFTLASSLPSPLEIYYLATVSDMFGWFCSGILASISPNYAGSLRVMQCRETILL